MIDLARESPYLTFFLLWIVVYAIVQIIRMVLTAWARLIRYLSIRRAGWPPEHLDADGDFRPLPDPKESEESEES